MNEALKLKEGFADAQTVKEWLDTTICHHQGWSLYPVNSDKSCTCEEIQLSVDNVKHRQNIRVNPRWCGVEYHAELCPGEIKQPHDGNYEVSILNRVSTI